MDPRLEFQEHPGDGQWSERLMQKASCGGSWVQGSKHEVLRVSLDVIRIPARVVLLRTASI